MKQILLLCIALWSVSSAAAQRINSYGEQSEDGRFQIATADNGCQGIIQVYSEQWLIPPIYQEVTIPKGGYLSAMKDGCWGLIDLNNQIIAPFQYGGFKGAFTQEKEYVSPGGYIIAWNVRDKYGVLDTDGYLVLDFKYDCIEDIYVPSKGRVLIIAGTKYDIAGMLMELYSVMFVTAGDFLIAPQVLIPVEMHLSGLQRITPSIYVGWGDLGAFVFNKEGRSLTTKLTDRLSSPISKSITQPGSPYMWLRTSIFGDDNGGWGLYKALPDEEDMETILSPKYESAERLASSSLIKIKNSAGKFGIVDFRGNEVLPLTYEDISLIPIIRHEGPNSYYLCATQNGQSQLLGADTKPVFPQTYEAFTYISGADNRYLAARRNGLWGIIDFQGNIHSKFIYDEIKFIYDGRTVAAILKGKDKEFKL